MRFVIILLLLSIFEHCLSQCPDSEDIYPCVCFKSSRTLSCTNITNFNGGSIATAENHENPFVSITLQNISATDLDLSGLEILNINKIIILENPKLTILKSAKSFIFTKALSIINNENLDFISGKLSIFIALFINIETLTLDNNKNLGFVKLTGTFDNLNHISIQNSGLKTFDFEILNSLRLIKLINLNNNLLTAVTIDVTNVNSLLEINLNNNNINNSLSIALNESVKNPNRQVKLFLENNNLSQLNQSRVFDFIVNANNHLYLKSNKFNCDCDYENTTWILRYNLQNNVHDLTCENLKIKSINIFNAETVLNCLSSISSPPTESYITGEPTTQEDEPISQTLEPEPSTVPDEPSTSLVTEHSIQPAEPTKQSTEFEPSTVTDKT